MELGRSAGAHRADRGGGIVRTVVGVWRGERVTDRITSSVPAGETPSPATSEGRRRRDQGGAVYSMLRGSLIPVCRGGGLARVCRVPCSTPCLKQPSLTDPCRLSYGAQTGPGISLHLMSGTDNLLIKVNLTMIENLISIHGLTVKKNKIAR